MPRTEITLPDDVDCEIDHLDVTIAGADGEVTRRLWYPDVTVRVETVTEAVETDQGETDDREVEAVVIESETDDAKTNATIGTFESHVRNMVQGVTEGWEYRMEVLYSHFPMQVNVEGEEVVIENFLGERAPRRTTIRGDTRVEVDGEEVVLSGPDKEDVGQTAANIEQLTRVSGKDTRVFQDGVYITEKPKGGA
ncbi:50S ribosomal protein L6 [Halalkalicoccus jeotgali]|uniref:Large ribosomal subunit protein uL6 n=1 Tax=Halalkalicoccus jeotgali (strain DSM 18796 / CECT 7217 / JCM 14584 / KCTC 4019 / B3) TaxID=795797 RepID=D8J9K1_HALJB|nr:50S ribosomal protein L6 [Halalkalicoccus jeotgali]ADJ14413.1 50S ribosomal protein L6P [Halalkalicoccus jeotgali B3]ELY40129.1 50S ribosomal protein L6P [Halalkalicoccus jeotgali B3]